MRKEKPFNIKVLLTIDFSDLSNDLAESLKLYGYYGEQAAKAWGRARVARIKRQEIAAALYFVSKENPLEHGRAPSDKYIEMELVEDKEWAEAQRVYSDAKVIAEKASVPVKGLEFKLESLRTFLANERLDKQFHLKSN